MNDLAKSFLVLHFILYASLRGMRESVLPMEFWASVAWVALATIGIVWMLYEESTGGSRP